MRAVICFCVLTACAWYAASYPIIGILTTPSDDHAGMEEFSASYVKWLESAGARVAVVPYNAGQDELYRLFANINGLLFTGGDQSLNEGTPYFEAAKFLYNLALDANQRGDIFPIWGTCMGFQLLCILGSGNHSILLENAFDAENLGLALELEPGADHGQLFGNAPPSVMQTLTQQPSTINLHHDGVTPEDFYASVPLMRTYRPLSTNVDRKGRRFVSALEARNMPIFGSQFHPERNAVEWNLQESELDHTPDAIYAMQYLARRFVRAAWQSTHRFEGVLSELIDVHLPTFTGNDPSQSFPDEQTYYFASAATRCLRPDAIDSRTVATP